MLLLLEGQQPLFVLRLESKLINLFGQVQQPLHLVVVEFGRRAFLLPEGADLALQHSNHVVELLDLRLQVLYLALVLVVVRLNFE